MKKFSARCSATLLLLATVTGHSASASATNKWYDATPDVPRPADFYAIHSETDHSVCGSILISLNKEYRIDPTKLDHVPRVSLPSDSLLSSDIQVPWTRKLVQQPDGENFKLTSLDVAQVRWKGRGVSLFRRTVEKSFPETNALAIDRVWMAEGTLPPLTLERTLTADAADRLIKGKEILADVTDIRNIGNGRNLAKSTNLTEPMLLNFAFVKGRLFLLAVDAVQAEIAAPRSNDGMVDLYVLEVLSDSNLRAVCWLSST